MPRMPFKGKNPKSFAERDPNNPEFEVTSTGTFRKGTTISDAMKKEVAASPKQDIFKMQRPLASNDPEPKILVYNESRTMSGQIPDSPEYNELFGEKQKVYVVGTFNAKGQMVIISGITDQAW